MRVKTKKKAGLFWRIVVSAVGALLILWRLNALSLGLFGTPGTAEITSVRRVMGERNEVIRNRYTYAIGYRFTASNGKTYSCSTTQIGGSAYLSAGGGTINIKYYGAAPFISVPDSDTGISLWDPLVFGIGVFLIYAINKSPGARKRGKNKRTNSDKKAAG